MGRIRHRVPVWFMGMAAVIDNAGPLLQDRYATVRRSTEALCSGLSAEDCNLQAMPDTSPAKWHLAHTTWFFETFILAAHVEGYRPFNDNYAVLFNSYYNGIGEQYPRPQRGLLTRPSLDEVLQYRSAVDTALLNLLDRDRGGDPTISELVELGLHHEAQHQELLLTDLKYGLYQNPLLPAYREAPALEQRTAPPMTWLNFEGGESLLGATGEDFVFDNELPRHPVLLQPFRIANRLVTNGEYLEFITAGGYREPEYWLSDGWAQRCHEHFDQPLYWQHRDNAWWEYTLAGLQPLNLQAPVAHISYFEAMAFASWRGKRLPTEAEWEAVANSLTVEGNFLDQEAFHPVPAVNEQDGVVQLFGDCWEWTNSSYLPYPGFRPQSGAIGEYNGKFMSGQMVLRGGSCLSQAFHIRSTYRNFFYPGDRWQCSGLRLAEDLPAS